MQRGCSECKSFSGKIIFGSASACRLMMHYISINFHKHILNGFQLIQWKQKDYCQTSKGNNSKKYTDKSYTSCGLTSSDDALYFCKVS